MNRNEHVTQPREPAGAGPALLDLSSVPVYASDELLGAHDEIRIVHEGVTYRLRRTARGKLILTK